MEALNQQLMSIVIPAAVTAISLLVSLALFKLKKYVEAQTNNATVGFAMARLCDIVQTTVEEIDQNVKEASADGSLTLEEAKRIKFIATNRVFQQIPPDLEATLNMATGNLKDWIDAKIEQTVHRQKE